MGLEGLFQCVFQVGDGTLDAVELGEKSGEVAARGFLDGG